jgi:hypothetical protein
VEGVSSLDPSRLHLAVWAQEHGNIETAPSTFRIDPDDDPNPITSDGDALKYAFTLHGFEYEVDIQYWYDADGDGEVGANDRIGRLPKRILGTDRGLFSGNMNTIEPIHLAAKPDSDDWGQWPEPSDGEAPAPKTSAQP